MDDQRDYEEETANAALMREDYDEAYQNAPEWDMDLRGEE